MSKLFSLALLGGTAVLLAGCGGGSGSGGIGGGGGGGGGTPPTLQSNFGAGFATAFGAGANTDPREPAAGDVIAVNVAADPVPVP